MTQLGYDMDGEPVEVPETATGWRVSRMKDQSGAPGLVYGSKGTPIVIPLDADIEDLRREVILPGRYRLEAVDENRRKLGAKFAYVCIPDTSAAAEPVIEVAPVRDEAATQPNAMAVVMEAMRQNSEMARTNADMARSIVDRFPAMMESAAILLKAADGAGLPAREPRRTERDDDDEDNDDEDNDDEDDGDGNGESAPEPASGSAFNLNALIAQLVPVLITAISNGDLKIPNLAEILDWRRAGKKKRAQAATAKGQAASTEKPETTAEPAAEAGSAGKAKTKPAPAEKPETTAEPAAAAEAPADAATDDELPPLSLQAMAHFLAIQAALTPEEAALARAAADELSPLDLRAWFDQLSAMTVPEAVERVRALLAASSKPEAA